MAGQQLENVQRRCGGGSQAADLHPPRRVRRLVCSNAPVELVQLLGISAEHVTFDHILVVLFQILVETADRLETGTLNKERASKYAFISLLKSDFTSKCFLSSPVQVQVITLLPFLPSQSFFLLFVRTSSSATCSICPHTSSSLPASSFTSGDSSPLATAWLSSCSSLLASSRQLRRDFR